MYEIVWPNYFFFLSLMIRMTTTMTIRMNSTTGSKITKTEPISTRIPRGAIVTPLSSSELLCTG